MLGEQMNLSLAQIMQTKIIYISLAQIMQSKTIYISLAQIMQKKTTYISLAQIMQTKSIYISLMAMWFAFCCLAASNLILNPGQCGVTLKSYFTFNANIPAFNV